VGASHNLVNEMTEDQSVRMLMAALPAPPADLAPLQALARRLGEWPLLLKLAASQLRERMARGDSSEGALAYVMRELNKRGFVAFDRANASERNDAVAKTIAVSLELLGAEDRVRCAALSIFPEDTMIPLGAARALWGIDAFDAEELVMQLDGAVLVDFDLKSGCLRIHDVLQAYPCVGSGCRTCTGYPRRPARKSGRSGRRARWRVRLFRLRRYPDRDAHRGFRPLGEHLA
jgi:hypothetical protein